METLDADCLLNIFSRLNLSERIRLESVCRRWHSILQNSCAFSDIHSVDVNKLPLPTTSKDLRQDTEKLQLILLSVIRRSGPFIRRIDFGGRWLRIQQPIVDCIAKYCHRIERFDVGCSIIDADISAIMLNNCETLEFFSIEDSSWTHPMNQSKVHSCFGQMKNLRYANLRHFTFAADRPISFGKKLKELDVSGVNGLKAETLRHILNEQADEFIELNMCPLPTLTSSQDDQEMQSVLDTFSKFKRLKMLNLGYIAKLPQQCSMIAFGGMSELRFLHLQDCTCVDVASLRAMTASMRQLRTVHLVKCPNIENYSCLANVKAIRELEIRHAKELQDADLIRIAGNGTLKRLRLEMCPNVTNDAIFRLLKSCPKLRELELTKCENIGENLFANPDDWASAKELQTLSLNGTVSITTTSMSAMMNTKLLETLHELDVSHNKNIDNKTMSLLRDAIADNSRRTIKTLAVYVFQTAVTAEMEEGVRPEIELIY